MSDKIAFVDTETTGLDPDRNPVWEVAVIVNGDEEHCWQVKVWPMPVVGGGDELPPGSNPYVSQWVIDNTGFGTRYNSAAALTHHESARRFAELTEGKHLAGLVPSFDEERLRRMHVETLGHPGRFPWHYHLIDVETAAVGALLSAGNPPELPWDSEHISTLFGVEPPSGDDRHSALGDARWARDLWSAIQATAS